MQYDYAINSFHLLGEEIRNFLLEDLTPPSPARKGESHWENTIALAEQENPWFTRENIINALKGISLWLDRDVLNKWLSSYSELDFDNVEPITIGVVMAGNIPLVGFHDFLCVLMSGNILHAKLSSSDSRLLKLLTDRLTEIEPEWKNRIHFVEKLNNGIDAVIATGSNNTARHFEYYFRNIPNIIRRNRNGIAILDGKETNLELHTLGKDIFSYFGLGCRNVSKLYVPEGYVFDTYFINIEACKEVINHNKYHSNYVYNRTIYLMDGKKFTDNGFLAVIQNPQLSSPIAVLNFEEYTDLKKLEKQLAGIKEQIQCVAVSESVRKKLLPTELPLVGIGETQSPVITDYADGVDVMEFLLKLQH